MRYVMAMLVGAAMIALSGCSSVPQQPNMTGKWNYEYIPSDSGKTMTGSMDLHQSDFMFSGTANDADGQFALSGSIAQKQFTLNGSDQSKGRTFTIKADLSSETAFAGTYQTNQGAAGTISGNRQ